MLITEQAREMESLLRPYIVLIETINGLIQDIESRSAGKRAEWQGLSQKLSKLERDVRFAMDKVTKGEMLDESFQTSALLGRLNEINLEFK